MCDLFRPTLVVPVRFRDFRRSHAEPPPSLRPCPIIMVNWSRKQADARRFLQWSLAAAAYVTLSAVARSRRQPPHAEAATPPPAKSPVSPRRFVLTAWAVVTDAGSGWLDHKAGQLGAALAYYSIFSIGPMLVVALAVAGLVYDES